MAERRMFALKITDSDAFLDMPKSSQALYFHLAMRADDDGFISNPKKIIRMIAASDDDMKILLAKRFLLSFDTGIVVIKHWRLHNYIAKDRYTETIYKEEKESLFVKANGAYSDHAEPVALPYTPRTQNDDTGKVSEDKVSEGKDTAETTADPAHSIPFQAQSLSNLLGMLHTAVDPKYHPTGKQVEAWAADIDKLNRLDGRDWKDIEAVIRWVKTPGEFWFPNIMSGKKLREKFPTLWGQMKRPAQGSRPRMAADVETGGDW